MKGQKKKISGEKSAKSCVKKIILKNIFFSLSLSSIHSRKLKIFINCTIFDEVTSRGILLNEKWIMMWQNKRVEKKNEKNC